MPRPDPSALALALVLACGPGLAQDPDATTGDSAPTNITGGPTDPAITSTTSTPTTGSEPPAACIPDEDQVLARFGLDLGDWPLDPSGSWVIDASCAIDMILPSSEIPVLFLLSCTDPMGSERPIELNLAKYPTARYPLQPGLQVALHLRAAPASRVERGAWTLRALDETLLLAGNRADTPGPAEPDFFAPLVISVDAALCPAGPFGSCADAQPLALAFQLDGEALTLGPRQHGLLRGEFDVIVERALQANGDPAPCSDDYTGPESLQFIIVGGAP